MLKKISIKSSIFISALIITSTVMAQQSPGLSKSSKSQVITKKAIFSQGTQQLDAAIEKAVPNFYADFNLSKSFLGNIAFFDNDHENDDMSVVDMRPMYFKQSTTSRQKSIWSMEFDLDKKADLVDVFESIDNNGDQVSVMIDNSRDFSAKRSDRNYVVFTGSVVKSSTKHGEVRFELIPSNVRVVNAKETAHGTRVSGSTHEFTLNANGAWEITYTNPNWRHNI